MKTKLLIGFSTVLLPLAALASEAAGEEKLLELKPNT